MSQGSRAAGDNSAILPTRLHSARGSANAVQRIGPAPDNDHGIPVPQARSHNRRIDRPSCRACRRGGAVRLELVSPSPRALSDRSVAPRSPDRRPACRSRVLIGTDRARAGRVHRERAMGQQETDCCRRRSLVHLSSRGDAHYKPRQGPTGARTTRAGRSSARARGSRRCRCAPRSAYRWACPRRGPPWSRCG